MRIGLFTDSYHPSTNGITVVVDIMRENLEALGHEVYIVAPASGLRWWKLREHNVMRFSALKGLFFDESSFTFFFPPKQFKKIKAQNLDAIIVFTPAQIGVLGAYAALRLDIPLVVQYCTDLEEYITAYPAVLPAVLALYSTIPFAVKSRPLEVAGIFKRLVGKRSPDRPWLAHSVRVVIGYFHDRSDAVISVSEKVTKLLNEWGARVPIHTIPTGVDKGAHNQKRVDNYRKKYNISSDTLVLLSLGRVAKEKNIDLLIDAMPNVLKHYPNTKLLVVGNFNYRIVLEQKVKDMGLQESVVFTGRVPMSERWDMYALSDIFCFPSLTDTQALVVNEAALYSLPIVWCDSGVNELLIDRTTGLKAKNDPHDYANKIIELLNDASTRKRFGKAAQKIALTLSEKNQTQKLLDVVQKLVVQKSHK